jgi:hypothetical protein
MKNQKRAMVVLLLIVSVFFTSFTPLVFAEEEPGTGDQNQGNTGDSSGNQQQGFAKNTNQMDPGGNQTGEQNQSGPGGPGYGDEKNTAENQHQYRYQKRYMNIEGEGNI